MICVISLANGKHSCSPIVCGLPALVIRRLAVGEPLDWIVDCFSSSRFQKKKKKKAYWFDFDCLGVWLLDGVWDVSTSAFADLKYNNSFVRCFIFYVLFYEVYN